MMLPRLKGSYGADSPGLAQDRAIITNPEDTKRRRTIRLTRETANVSWGFTLQTYGIRNKKTSEVEVMSYVDYVELHGSAWVAGMRRGDIILSVNGDSVEYSTHMELVHRIKQCKREMRLVVLFENCCKKVELHERYLKLKKLLALKLKELKRLEEDEHLINQGVPPSQIDAMRRSTSSSISLPSDWDAYSEIISPSMLNGALPNQFVFRNDLDSETSTSSGSIALDSSFSSDRGPPSNNINNNSGGGSIPSSSLDSRSKGGESSGESEAHGFVQSGQSQSDVSVASANSEEGLKHMYNITRCAEHMAEACRCSHVVPTVERTRCLKETRKDDSSMTNLVEDCGVQMRAIKATMSSETSEGGGQVKGILATTTTTTSRRDSAHRVKGEKLFYTESDSEDSIMSADVEDGSSRRSMESSGSFGLGVRCRLSENSESLDVSSRSVLEKEEEKEEEVRSHVGSRGENLLREGNQNGEGGKNQHNIVNYASDAVTKECSGSRDDTRSSSYSHTSNSEGNGTTCESCEPRNARDIPSTATASLTDVAATDVSKDVRNTPSSNKQNLTTMATSGREVPGHSVDYRIPLDEKDGASDSPHKLFTATATTITTTTTTTTDATKLGEIEHTTVATNCDHDSMPRIILDSSSVIPSNRVNLFQIEQDPSEPAGATHSKKKRIVDGILVSDENQSTRL